MTPEEYLAFERASETKHEYFDGEIIDFAGASLNHIQLVQNLGGLFYVHGRAQGCRSFPTDLRLRIGKGRSYTYPDVVVVCGELQLTEDQKDTLLNPTIIFEVLSNSTEDIDRGRKFLQYTALPSLQEYILVSQDRPLIEQYTRQPDGSWRYINVTDLTDQLTLPSANCTFSLSDIYENVIFPPEPPDQEEILLS
jgi:Uma2 family endonuclease